MLVEEVSSPGDLLAVQVTAPCQVHPCTYLLRFNNCRIPACFIQILEVRECSAHGAAYEQRRLLLGNESLCLGILRVRDSCSRFCTHCNALFSGPLASFVGKNFDTRQDAGWGQLRNEAVCSPSRHTLDRCHGRRKGTVVGSTRRERRYWRRALTDVSLPL